MNWKKVKNVLLGKALKSEELEGEKLGRFWGVPIMSSDAVSSVAYAIEEMLLVLVPIAGLSSVGYLGYVSAPIILLVLVLAFSYSQIITAYPNGGGAYVVSEENIGKGASLVAASALIIDYIMTVAVSISAATAALISAFPALAGHKLLFAVAFLCIITLLNLRGMRESSKIFGTPTYAFILIMLALIVTGAVKLFTGNLESPVYSEAELLSVTGNAAGTGVGVVSIFLLLRAFSSGCSALTGVEVVSNAVPNFREPSQRNAKQVLFILIGVIIVLLGGTVFLVTKLDIIPLEDKTVISQLGLAVFGHNPMFYILQFATSLILLLAANTAYNGLPTFLSILAKDGYVPRQFMHRGTRLSFSNGIMFIFIAAGILLIVFNADTHHLIPLYSVGVFISFTLSQAGMVVKWMKSSVKGKWHRLAINGLGALMTGIGAVIVFSTKFVQGAWALAIAVPILILLMNKIRRHYDFVARQLQIDDFMSKYRKSKSTDENLCIVLVGEMNRSLLKSLNYANLLTSNVIALCVATDEKYTADLKERWERTGIDIPLEILNSPYREIIEPIEDYISKKESALLPGDTITVVMSRFMEKQWYANFLHNQTAYFITKKLSAHRNVATVLVPYIYSDR